MPTLRMQRPLGVVERFAAQRNQVSMTIGYECLSGNRFGDQSDRHGVDAGFAMNAP